MKLVRVGLVAVAAGLVGCLATENRQSASLRSPSERDVGDSVPPSGGVLSAAPTVQQANGALAANVEASLRAEISALRAEMIQVKGIEYRSDLPWKAVLLCVCVLASQQAMTCLVIVLSHKREMARLRAKC